MITKPQRSRDWIQCEIDRLIDMRYETMDPNLQNEYTMQIVELRKEWAAVDQALNDAANQQTDDNLLLKSDLRLIKDLGQLVSRVSANALAAMSDAYSVGADEVGYQDHQLAYLQITSLGNSVRDLSETWLKAERLILDIEANIEVVRNIANNQ